MKRKEDRLEMLRVRRNRAFSLARYLETRIASEPDIERRAVLRTRLAAANACMRNALARMSRAGTTPSNKDIAEVLGVPKGCEVVALIPVGYPAKDSPAPRRREICEFTHYDKF